MTPVVIVEETGDKSPYSKSKTKNFEAKTFEKPEEVDVGARKARPPALRKMTTMTKSPDKNKNKNFSSRNQAKQI